MKRQEKHAIEARLPRRYRRIPGYKRLLADLDLRVSVSGIRGKSQLTKAVADALQERGLSVYAKQTGTDPVSIKDGVVHPIVRNGKKTVLDETLWEVKKYAPMEAIVLENQGITPYTMKAFNELLCQPNYLLITNIRRDHQGDIARGLKLMAKYFVRSAPRGCTIINGERDVDLRVIMRREARQRGVRFLDASPGRMVVPGYESVTILDKLLQDWMGEGLTHGEMRMHHENLVRTFRWRQSALPGKIWFNGGEINDVDSTDTVLRYLRHQTRDPISVVAYFRHDRPDRTASFVGGLRAWLKDGTVERVYLAGHRSNAVARALRQRRAVEVLPDRPDGVRLLRERLLEQPDGAVMTVANAVPPWPRSVNHMLRTGSPEPEEPATSAPAPARTPQTMEVLS